MTTSAAKWFQDRVKGLPADCIVRTRTSVDPASIPGDHISVVFKRGIRTWAFPTPEAAEAFMKEFGNGK